MKKNNLQRKLETGKYTFWKAPEQLGHGPTIFIQFFVSKRPASLKKMHFLAAEGQTPPPKQNVQLRMQIFFYVLPYLT